jgi:hypothetical protein
LVLAVSISHQIWFWQRQSVTKFGFSSANQSRLLIVAMLLLLLLVAPQRDLQLVIKLPHSFVRLVKSVVALCHFDALLYLFGSFICCSFAQMISLPCFYNSRAAEIEPKTM